MSKERYDVSGFASQFIKSCNGWDQASDSDEQYYDAELAIDIGTHKAGSIIDTFVLLLKDTDAPCVQLFYGGEGKTYEEFPILFEITFGEPTNKSQ